MGLFDNEIVDIEGWPDGYAVIDLRTSLTTNMTELDSELSRINSEISTCQGLHACYTSIIGKINSFDEKSQHLTNSKLMVDDISSGIDDPYHQGLSAIADGLCAIDATKFTTANTIGLTKEVRSTTNYLFFNSSHESVIVLDSLNLTDFLGVDREQVDQQTVYNDSFIATTTTLTTVRQSDPYFSKLFQDGYNAYIEQALAKNEIASQVSDGAEGESLSYEDYIACFIPKEQEYDRYAGYWNEMLAGGFDACLGLGLLYKAITGEEAFTGDQLTDNERISAGKAGILDLTLSVALAAIGASSVGGFFGSLLADSAGGFIGGASYKFAANCGWSDGEAFLFSMLMGMTSGSALDDMFSKSPTVLDDLAKRLGKSSDEMADIMGNLNDLAVRHNYSSVDDMLENLTPSARDDILNLFDKPSASLDLDMLDDYLVKNHVYDANEFYKEIAKKSDDINQIVKNSGLDPEDVTRVKNYLFNEEHLMPDGTYRKFDASDEIADAWKRLMDGNGTEDDIKLFNHELAELQWVEKGYPTDVAHILASFEYNLSSISNLDDFAKRCSEIYGRDFYFGAGTSDDAIDAIIKQIDNLDGQVDDVIEGGLDANLLDDMGKFADDMLENNYQAYVNRKISKGKTPKDRLEWKKASDYWTKESPVARGNNFNKTVREADIYDYHEVYLENGKRLDSYDPDAGEIISRKATDLDKITEETYRGYLSEFSQKYSEGTKIRSNAYPELDGQELKGQYILEIPASNADISNIDYYKQIAAEYDVILRFTEEVQ